MEFYGREYHLRACDDFTREYLLSEGIQQQQVLQQNEQQQQQQQQMGFAAGLHLARQQQASRPPSPAAEEQETEPNKRDKGKLKKFLENDGKVLR